MLESEVKPNVKHPTRSALITAILHNMLGTPRMRAMRDAARKAVDAVAVGDCLRARFQCMH